MTDELFSSKRLTEDDEWAVLGLILRKGSSWTSEIANNFEYAIDDAKLLLRRLLKKKLIRQFYPDALYPQPLIKCRIPRLLYQGIDSYGKITERNWFCATILGIQLYAEKMNGSHHEISASYLQEYEKMRVIS